MSDIPENHPRYRSLMARHRLELGLASGMTTPTGLIAHGRGEAFDYLLGETTIPSAKSAIRAAAALLLLAQKPIISVNGNSAALVPEAIVSLARAVPCEIEINLFHDAPSRRELIAQQFQNSGLPILGVHPDAYLPGLSSARARVDSRGIALADVVIVSIEDGDRTAALMSAGKRVIAIDLNPLSRTPQTASISIIDNVERAFPALEHALPSLRGQTRAQLESVVASFDNRHALDAAIGTIRQAIPGLPS